MNIQQEKLYLTNQDKTMKAYYYLLFRIYKYNTDYLKKDVQSSMLSTSIISSFVLAFTLFTILVYVDNYCYPLFGILFPNKLVIVIYAIIVFCINNWLIIKKEKFLKFNFEKTKTGTFLIILFVLFLITSFYYVVDKHTKEIFDKRRKQHSEQNIK